MLLLCSIIFIVAALILLRWPPRSVNHMYGYRTPAAMASQERWVFAQRHGAQSMLRAGVLMLILSWPSMRFLDGIGEEPTLRILVETAVLIAACIGMFIRTERALKKRFGPTPKKEWSKSSG